MIARAGQAERSEEARRQFKAARRAELPPEIAILRDILADQGALQHPNSTSWDVWDPSHLLRLAAAQGGDLEQVALASYEQHEVEWFGPFQPELLFERLPGAHKGRRSPFLCQCAGCRGYALPRTLSIEAIEFAVRFHVQNVRDFDVLAKPQAALELTAPYEGVPRLRTVCVPVGAGDRDCLVLSDWGTPGLAHRIPRRQGVGTGEPVKGLLKRWGLVSWATWTSSHWPPSSFGLGAWRDYVAANGWRWQKHPHEWTMARIPWRTL